MEKEREIKMSEETKAVVIQEPLKTRTRDPFYDNIRLFLMFCVVLCHGLVRVMSTSRYIEAVYMIFHLFTMPCFVLLTGYFAKGMAKGGSPKRLHIINIVLLYVVVQLVKMAIDGSKSIFVPQYGNWFLTAMVFWYAVLPAVSKFKPWFVLSFSVVVSLLVGMDGNRGLLLQMQRTFSYFPFFMLGFYLDKDRAEIFKKNKVRVVGAAVFVLSAAICLLWCKIPGASDTMYGSYNYKTMEISNLYGAGMRFFWYILALAMSFGIVCIVPRKKNIFTVIGTRTLPIFVIHTVVYRYLHKRTDFFDWLKDFGRGYTRLALVIAISVAVTLICGNRWFAAVFNKFMAWDFKFLLKKEKQE